MNKNTLWVAGGVAALSLAMIALPAPPAKSQAPDDCARAQALWDQTLAEAEVRNALQEVEVLPQVMDVEDDVSVLLDEEGSGWLGVELHEVTGDSAKELKLPAERGVVLGRVVPDSPAAKAGLKENDVVTEINGQRVEGAAQFRRMIHEIPAGRTVQLTLWREGRAQSVSVTLGKAEERRNSFKVFTPGPGAPGNFTFRMPEMPSMEWDGNLLIGGRPRLGIDAEDLNGQLGTFFGAPDGEGILVREVNPGSAAEKAGVKAGDVIISVNGERVRTIGDLREKLAAKREANADKDKGQTVKLGVFRNKSEVSLNVELPAPAERTKRLISHRTNI